MLGAGVGVAVVFGLGWLVRAAMAPGAGSRGFRILSFDVSPMTVLAMLAFVALIALILFAQRFGQRRAERDLQRTIQARRRRKQEEG